MTVTVANLSGAGEAHRRGNRQASPETCTEQGSGMERLCQQHARAGEHSMTALWTIEVRRSDGSVLAAHHLRVPDSGPDAVRAMVAAGIRVPKGWNVSWDESWRFVAIEPRAA